MSSTIIGLCAEVAWWLALGVIVLATMPRRPRASQPDNSLSPGMQVLLAHRARKGWIAPAADATFIDLVHRGWIDASPHEVRLGKGDGKSLDQAEEIVFDHVKAVVEQSPYKKAPMAAIQEGPGASDGWQGFGASVEAAAEKRGLLKERVPLKTMAVMGAAGGLASGWLIYSLTGKENIGVLIGVFVIAGILHAMPLMPLHSLTLTPAGADAAGPIQTVANRLTLSQPRSNHSGWTHDRTIGWRQWEVTTAPANDVTFKRWPEKIMKIMAIIWAVSLGGALLSIGTDRTEFVAIAGFTFTVYFAAIMLRLGAGAYRGIVAKQRGREFERTRTPIAGQVVRKYERVYHVGEDRNQVTEHCVVIDPGPGQAAVMFTVRESVYDSVEEGRTRARALQKWRSTDAQTFEVSR